VSGGTKRKQHSNTPQQSPKRTRVENRVPDSTPSVVNAGNVSMQVNASITNVAPRANSIQNPVPPAENQARQQQAQMQIPPAESPDHQPPGENSIHQQLVMLGNRQRTTQTAEETFTTRNIANELENRTINQQHNGTPLQPAFPVETVRFNPYLAPVGDPVYCRMLLSTELYRVVWFTIQPVCVFTLRTYSPTMVTFFIFCSSLILSSHY